VNIRHGDYVIIAIDNKDGTWTVKAPGSRLIPAKTVKASSQEEAFRAAGYA
jgi:hypothetical protein